MKILVVDGQGGKIGRTLIETIKKAAGDAADITAVGTNSIATAGMIKAGADRAATGENAVMVAARGADIIVGPIGIVLADSLVGEVTPKMAAAIAASPARRILIPFQGCNTHIAGMPALPLGELVQKAAEAICDAISKA